MSSRDPTTSTTGSEPPSGVEALLARCLDRARRIGPKAVDEICRENPEHAEQIRAHIESLRRIGLLTDELAETRPSFLGRYRTIEKLGMGGMGVVYLAEDDELGRRVALKCIDARFADSEKARERFQREIRVVAKLRHPHIVTIYDVGEQDGVPFFTMEYVQGATLAEMIRSLRERGAPVAELTPTRLAAPLLRGGEGEAIAPERWGRTYVEAVCRLVLDVAAALSHVHAHGIVHRDVKPSNVLVDRAGRGLLFDLGLAHLDDDTAITRTGDLAGTPHYASPEQISGRPKAIDARTDVYSLGVTLYEMLTLTRPFNGATPAQVLRQIQLQEPMLPRDLAPIVPRDLETICLTAMEKEPARRYASVDEMADDVRRFLGFRPIRARPIGNVRRMARFARRNPALTVASVLAVLVAVGTPLGLFLANRAYLEQALAAQREAEKNKEISQFLESLFLDVEESGVAENVAAARAILEDGSARLETDPSISRLTRSTLMETLARIYGGIGLPERAVPLLDRAFAIRNSELGEHDANVASLLGHLAAAHLALDRPEDARALAERSLEAFRRAEAEAAPEAAIGLLTLGDLSFRDGDLAGAIGRYEQALAIQRGSASSRPNEDDVAATLERLGDVHRAAGRTQEAERMIRESLAIRTRRIQPRLEAIASGLVALASLHESLGDLDRAEGVLEEALGLYRKGYGEGHPGVERALVGLTRIYERWTVVDPARDLRAGRRLLLLANGRLRGGKADAARTYHAALQHLERSNTADPGDVIHALIGCTDALLRTGRIDEAMDVAARATAVAAEHDAGGLVAAGAARVRAEAERAAGNLAEAAHWFERQNERLREIDEIGPRERSLALEEEALAQAAIGSTEDAIERFIVAARARRATSPTPAPLFADEVETEYQRLFQLGITALQSSRHDEAIRAFEACLEQRPLASICAYNIACTFAIDGDVERSIAWLNRAAQIGLASRADGIDLVRGDDDLAAVRSHPDFPRLVEQLERRRASADAYAREPAVYVPPALAGTERWPLLLVLHADGKTKESVVAGPWRAVADALGFALLAPSGRIPVDAGPRQGMAWVDVPERYDLRHLEFERPVLDAYQAFRERHDVDPKRVLIAGEGTGGTLAFNIAVRAPGLFQGVLLKDASIHVGLARGKAGNVGRMGVKVVLVVAARSVPDGTRRRFQDWGMDATVIEQAETKGDSDATLLADGVRLLLADDRRARDE